MFNSCRAVHFQHRETQLSFRWIFFLMSNTSEHLQFALATFALHKSLYCKDTFVMRVFPYAAWSKVLAFRAPLLQDPAESSSPFRT